jgi:group I intron endonuclease
MAYRKVPGIYQILCSGNSKVYVGSAVSIHARWASHRSQLRWGGHGNKHLQNAWAKYGEASFHFSVIEHCEVDALIQREQHWIDTMKAADVRHGMNNSPTATTTLGFRHSEATRTKLAELAAQRDHSHLRANSAAMRGKPGHSAGKPGTKWTEEQRRAASIRRKGQKAWNVGVPMAPEVRARVSETMKRMGVNRTISDETRDQVCALRATGMFYEAISKETGVSPAQAQRIANHIEVGPRRGLKRLA